MVSARPGQRRPIPDRGCLSMPSICAPPPPRGATLQEGSTATRDTDEEEVEGRDGGTGKGRSWRTAHTPGTQHPQSGAWRDIFECRRGTAPASQSSIYTHGSRHTSTGRNGEQGGEGEVEEEGRRQAGACRAPPHLPPAAHSAPGRPSPPHPTYFHAHAQPTTTNQKKKRGAKSQESAHPSRAVAQRPRAAADTKPRVPAAQQCAAAHPPLDRHGHEAVL